ncbi:MAG: hypothetical protein BWK73_33255 [Thiothrix lacustris]|uniref:Uncharacterized protein n=1 Tax=Thiothrix lacustris TaxID=525917 RepID=A0A1Y1QHL7_9GAMM|nr:MAG: hypothetical protein BWK73_33255 [Thiothrix lacustris]
MNRMQCSNLDNIYINTKETMPILEGAPDISREIFLSKYTGLLDRRLLNYLHSGSIPLKSDMKNPFCARMAQILTPRSNNTEIALLDLKKDWLNKFEEEIKSVTRNNPTVPVTECNHVVLPMTEAYLRKIDGDPAGFYTIKPQYDECISLSLSNKLSSKK